MPAVRDNGVAAVLFTSFVIQRTVNLPLLNFTPQNNLTQGNYYWRVTAYDPAGNASNTISGDLPPSSSETFFTVSAATAMTRSGSPSQ